MADDIKVKILADVAPFIQAMGSAARFIRDFARRFDTLNAAIANTAAILSSAGLKIRQLAAVMGRFANVIHVINGSFYSGNSAVLKFAAGLFRAAQNVSSFGRYIQRLDPDLVKVVIKLRESVADLLNFGKQAQNTGSKSANAFQRLVGILGRISAATNSLKFVSVLGQLQSLVFGVTNAIKNLGFSLGIISQQLNYFGKTVFGVLAPIVQLGADLDRNLSGVQAVVEGFAPGLAATAQEAAVAQANFEKLRNTVLDLSTTTIFSAAEIAEAARELGLVGFTAEEIFTSLPNVLALAAAGAIDVGRAAEIAADITRAFKLEASDLTRVIDALAVSAAASSTDVEQLAQSMKYVAPSARSLGISVETTSAAIGVLGNAGIKGSSAGTALTNLFVGLTRGGKKLDAALHRLGLTFEDVNLASNKLSVALARLERLTPAEVFAAFNARGAKAFNAIRVQGVGALQAIEDQIKTGTYGALDIARIQLNNVGGAIKIFRSQVERLGIALFDTFKTQLTQSLEVFRYFANVLQEVVQKNKEFVAGVAQALGALAGLALALGAAVGGAASIVTILGTGASLIGVVVASILGLASALAITAIPLGVFVLGFTGIVSLVGSFIGLIGQALFLISSFGIAMGLAFAEMSKGVDKATGSISRFQALLSLLYQQGVLQVVRGFSEQFKGISGDISDASKVLEDYIASLLEFGEDGDNAFTKVGRAVGDFAKQFVLTGLEAVKQLPATVDAITGAFLRLGEIIQNFTGIQTVKDLQTSFAQLRLDILAIGDVFRIVFDAVVYASIAAVGTIIGNLIVQLRNATIWTGVLTTASGTLTLSFGALVTAIQATIAALTEMTGGFYLLIAVVGLALIGIYRWVRSFYDVDEAQQQTQKTAKSLTDSIKEQQEALERAQAKLKQQAELLQGSNRKIKASINDFLRFSELYKEVFAGDPDLGQLYEIQDAFEALREHARDDLGYTKEQIDRLKGTDLAASYLEKLEADAKHYREEIDKIIAQEKNLSEGAILPTDVIADKNALTDALKTVQSRIDDFRAKVKELGDVEVVGRIRGVAVAFRDIAASQEVATQKGVELATSYDRLREIIRSLPPTLEELETATSTSMKELAALGLTLQLELEKAKEELTGVAPTKSIDIQLKLDTIETNKEFDKLARDLAPQIEVLGNALQGSFDRLNAPEDFKKFLDQAAEAERLATIENKTVADSIKLEETYKKLQEEIAAIIKDKAGAGVDAEKKYQLVLQQGIDIERKRRLELQKNQVKADLATAKSDEKSLDNKKKIVDKGRDYEIDILKKSGKEIQGIRLEYEKKLQDELATIRKDAKAAELKQVEIDALEAQATLANKLDKNEAIRQAADAARKKAQKSEKVERAELVDIETKIFERLLAQANTAQDILNIFRFLLYIREELGKQAEKQGLRALGFLRRLAKEEARLEELKKKRREEKDPNKQKGLDERIRRQQEKVDLAALRAQQAAAAANLGGALAGRGPQFANVDPLLLGLKNALGGAEDVILNIFKIFDPAVMIGNTKDVVAAIQEFATNIEGPLEDISDSFTSFSVVLGLRFADARMEISGFFNSFMNFFQAIPDKVLDSIPALSQALLLALGTFESFTENVRYELDFTVQVVEDGFEQIALAITKGLDKANFKDTLDKILAKFGKIRDVAFGDIINAQGDIQINNFTVTMNGIYDARSAQFKKAVEQVIKDTLKDRVPFGN